MSYKYKPKERICPRHFGPSFSSFDERSVKWLEQREKYGYDERELWNLDRTVLSFLLPRLKWFRDAAPCYPIAFDSPEQWKQEIDKVIGAIERLVVYDIKTEIEDFSVVSEFLGKYFFQLWW